MERDPDETVLIPRARDWGRRHWLVVLFGLLALCGGGGAWVLWPHASGPAPHVAALVERVPPLATEAEILAHAPDALTLYRFAPQPAILVLQFPTLLEQGRTLNRAAALLEKEGFPRDRALDDTELDQRIRAGGGTSETFYYGHDYRAADLLRFFASADQSGVRLTAEEQRLRDLLRQVGWRDGMPPAALISLVRLNPAAGLDAPARAAILRHELSHGEYFTSPVYATYAHRFWTDTLSSEDRRQFTAFLTTEGYDPALSDLMINETQAYLMHTADPRFFDATAVGIPERRLDELRALFLTGMPPGWLRDCTKLPFKQPRQRRGAVRIRRTAAARRPCRPAASSAVRRSSK